MAFVDFLKKVKLAKDKKGAPPLPLSPDAQPSPFMPHAPGTAGMLPKPPGIPEHDFPDLPDFSLPPLGSVPKPDFPSPPMAPHEEFSSKPGPLPPEMPPPMQLPEHGAEEGPAPEMLHDDLPSFGAPAEGKSLGHPVPPFPPFPPHHRPAPMLEYDVEHEPGHEPEHEDEHDLDFSKITAWHEEKEHEPHKAGALHEIHEGSEHEETAAATAPTVRARRSLDLSKPLFIKVQNYVEVMDKVNELCQDVKNGESSSTKVADLNAAEANSLEALRRSVEAAQKSVSQVDSILFKSQAQ